MRARSSAHNSVTALSHSALELFKEYQEEAYTISLHPSGHFIVVGFADKLRLMNLLIDDIRPFKEYSVRGCKEVKTVGPKSVWRHFGDLRQQPVLSHQTRDVHGFCLCFSTPTKIILLDLKPCGIPSVIGLGISSKIRAEKQSQDERPS